MSMCFCDLKELRLIGRALHLIGASLLLAVIIFDFIVYKGALSNVIRKILFIFFLVKMVLSELNLRFLLTCFPYMRFSIGKGAFMMFVGSLSLGYPIKVGFFFGVAMIGIGIALIGFGLFLREKPLIFGTDQKESVDGTL